MSICCIHNLDALTCEFLPEQWPLLQKIARPTPHPHEFPPPLDANSPKPSQPTRDFPFTCLPSWAMWGEFFVMHHSAGHENHTHTCKAKTLPERSGTPKHRKMLLKCLPCGAAQQITWFAFFCQSLWMGSTK